MTEAELGAYAAKLLAAIPGAGQNLRATVALLRACKARVLADGEVLCREGQNGDSVYFLVRGKLRVESTVRDGARNLFLQEAPAMLGQLSLVDGSPRSATLAAAGEAELLVLPQTAWTMLYGAPTVAGGALRRLVLASLTGQLARASYLLNDMLPANKDDSEVDMRALGRLAGVVQGWEMSDAGLDRVEVVRGR